MTAASEVGVDATTAVVAPHIHCPDDTPPHRPADWGCSGNDWAHGYADTSGATPPIYSYGVMDQIVNALADKSVFPNLTRIVAASDSREEEGSSPSVMPPPTRSIR